MFVLCPHCHFLVGLDPRTGAPPARCPKCDRPLGDAREAAVDVVQAEAPVGLAPPSREETTAADVPLAQPASPERVTADASPAANAPAATAPAPLPPEESTAPPRLDADAMIAAMAAKAPRRAGPTRKKTESARPAPAATPTVDTASSNASAPLASTSRAQRGKRKSAPAPAQQPIPQAKAPADPQPRSQRPAASTWWTSLLQAWRTRAAAAGARKDAKATSTTTPAFDPLAASVRNRARNRRVAAEATPIATSTAESTAAPIVGANAPATPAAAATTGTTRSDENASSSAPHLSPSAETPTVQHSVASPLQVEPAPTSPSQSLLETPAAPTSATATAATSSVAEAQPAAAEGPFVERRRNPDVPVPPGTIPTHPLRRRTDAPSFARAQAASAAQRRGWRWPAAVAALSLLLVLQLLLAQRDTLAADGRWRPTVSALCTLLRCQLPPWREPGAFTMLSRDVRAHPSAPGALLINASFRNDARWPQPWPRVLLTLSNVDGRIVGARAFAAKEYLGADTAATQHELAPGQTAAMTLAVVEPAPDIVAFSFDFR
jgi:hypothetical protein